jgi:hypothetical protein
MAIFPHAEHGIYEFETKEDGGRDDTRNPDGYFAMLRDFARDGRLKGRYGASIVTLPKLPNNGHSRTLTLVVRSLSSTQNCRLRT